MAQSILIIGSDSLIGNTFYHFLKVSGLQTFASTRRLEQINNDKYYFDLTDPLSKLVLPEGTDVAVICAGITNIESCMIDPEKTAYINVIKTIELIEYLVNKNIFVIYISTNQVFDGSFPHCPPDTPYSAITEYGRQKTVVESKISKMGKSVAIIRLTKIIESNFTLFVRWKNDLIQGKTITPYSDLNFSPLPLNLITSCLKLVIDSKLSGVIQISGEQDLSYAKAAYIAAEILRINSNRVQPTQAPKSSIKYGKNYTTLCIDRLLKVLGIRPPDVQWTVRNAFNQIKCITDSTK